MESASWKKCNMKQVLHDKNWPKKRRAQKKTQCGKSVIWKICNLKRITLEISTRIVHHRIQMDNVLSIDWTRPEIKVDIQVC